jgi:preprotein translocase subunit SecA
MRHFDVQLLGALALHEGLIVEMKTGEGKTLAATLPAMLNGLGGQGVHIVTVNDYLAQRDAEWMGPLYRFWGLTVGVILEQMAEQEDEELALRHRAYRCDVTYGTNHEIAFDYLRDNLAQSPQETVQRGFHYAIVDEVDFLLIDEARTPLVISGPAGNDAQLYPEVDRVIRTLEPEGDFVVDGKIHAVSLTEAGIDKVEQGLGVKNLTDLAHLDLYHAAHQSLAAHALYQRDVDYVVIDGQVLIVDEFTGRISDDKRYADGLHAAIEAKEGVEIVAEDETLAKVTYQTFFGRYAKLAGMTGTAWSEREEFRTTYGRDVQVIPTAKPMIRRDYQDLVFFSQQAKHQAIVQEISELHLEGRPVLVGTPNIKESEQLSQLLALAKIEHAVLNAKNHRAEAMVIAQAGRQGAVTISTNMAGRGTDIILGGNPQALISAGAITDAQEKERIHQTCTLERQAVVAAGGLHVLGTAVHESRRIDDQLRGRAGRQGDPGSSQFFLSLEDALWKKFGKEVIRRIQHDLSRKNHPPEQPLTSGKIRRVLRSLQEKVEQENFLIRRDVLQYDLVVHLQRETIYRWRQTLVSAEGYDPQQLVVEFVEELSQRFTDYRQCAPVFQAHFQGQLELTLSERGDVPSALTRRALQLLQEREKSLGKKQLHEHGRLILLQSIDQLWTDHLSNLERIEDGIGLHGFTGGDPLIEWRRQAHQLWHELLWSIRSRAVKRWFIVKPLGD